MSNEKTTQEPQYNDCLEIDRTFGRAPLGLMTNQVWHDDPRRLTFVLARYKFVAKMLAKCASALEVGCADAFGTRIVQQEVPRVVVSDFDPVFIDDVKRRASPRWPIEALVHDFVKGPFQLGGFDAAYAIDVIEHITTKDEDNFMRHVVAALQPHGICLIGTPSIHSQAYASPPSKAGHVNCKDADGLRTLMGRFFYSVFIFSMNDEVVHTGFTPMAHYLWAIGSDRRQL